MTAVMIRDMLAFGLGLMVGTPIAYLALRLRYHRRQRRYYI